MSKRINTQKKNIMLLKKIKTKKTELMEHITLNNQILMANHILTNTMSFYLLYIVKIKQKI